MKLPRCEICQAFLECVSDAPFGFGRITYHHVGPCVPKIYKYEPDEEDSKPGRRKATRKCVECKKPFVPVKCGDSQKICGTECREARRDRKHKESEQRVKLRWMLGKVA